MSRLGKDLSRRDFFHLSATAALASAIPAAGAEKLPTRIPANDKTPGQSCQYTGVGALYHSPDSAFRRVTFEVSLKPFCRLENNAIEDVCREIFRSWAPLLHRCDGCAVMLWAADGSEILDYAGNMDAAFDWSRYLGDANPPKTPPAGDPNREGAHARNWLYMKDPPRMTYGWLRTIIDTLKRVGREMTGKPVSIGATFDPGGEFAYSDFKFHRHPEIATSGTRGANSWVNCTARLNADTRVYAAYPHGIPQGTPFGVFFGRQSQHFLADLGYDYIWFSNGLGFALSPWSVTGPLFDGAHFDAGPARKLHDEILSFWRDFRSGCPRFPIETRGTNMTVGADLSANASPILDIYRGGFGVVAPPNSPWAAIDGDVGLEIIGYLSRIAELPPGDIFPFRFYTHDPWWMNSPWLDRYGQSPYDIFLPLALARVDGTRKITSPAYLEFLTIDNSWGQMPEEVPNEVTPYILSAMDDFSDAPGLVTWIYPFDEYNAMTFGSSPRLAEVFFGDWFLRDAVNDGFPLNSVVSTRQFTESFTKDPSYFDDTILLAYAPVAHGKLEALLLQGLERGQKVFLYGPLTETGQRLRSLLHLRKTAPLFGELAVHLALEPDEIEHGRPAGNIMHTDLTSAGSMDAVVADPKAVEVCASVSQNGSERAAAIFCARPLGGQSGSLAWVRGSFSSSVVAGKRLPQPNDPTRYYPSENIMRLMLAKFGYAIRFVKPQPQSRSPLALIARHKNGFFLSSYFPDGAVALRLRFPHGAPLPVESETWFEDGFSTYTPPRAWHKEIRCFVDQKESGAISCEKSISENPFIERRLLIKGLKNATVHFYPENGRKVYMALNDLRTYIHPSMPYVREDGGKRLVAQGVTGELLISW